MSLLHIYTFFNAGLETILADVGVYTKKKLKNERCNTEWFVSVYPPGTADKALGFG